MSIRKRIWSSGGQEREAWVVDYRDLSGKRRIKTFALRRDATTFDRMTRRAEDGGRPWQIASPAVFRMLEFETPLPKTRRAAGRAMVADAFRGSYPTTRPLVGEIAIHVFAQVPPSSVVPDVDNLLKPVLDALSGIAYVNDTQIVECMVCKIPSSDRLLRIKIWQVAPPRQLK